MASPSILMVCGREPDYVRNQMLWRTVSERFYGQLVADRRQGSLSLRLLRLLPPLVMALRRRPDLVVIGFYGHPLVPLVRRLTRAPILFDAFVSTYDTLTGDRRQFGPDSLLGRLAFRLDQLACRDADLVMVDTENHAHYFRETFRLAPAKVETLYLGCDERLFRPAPNPEGEPFTVFTYSTYLPLHGVDTIIQAAAFCREHPIHFRLVGDQGLTYPAVRRLADQLALSNVTFVPGVPFAALPDEISRAAVCLGGHFGPTAKARRVIAGKTYQFIAAGKPVIVGDNPANRELFAPGENAAFSPMHDPAGLAEAILALYRDPALRRRLAEGGTRLFQKRLTWQILGDHLEQLILRCLG